MEYTYEQIASDFGLWGTYVDPMGLDTEEAFNAISLSDKIGIIAYCFGEE
jgi:hypothetical protein